MAERDATEQKDVAQTQRDLAVRNFEIAKNAADQVVYRIAQDLRDVQGMRVDSLRRILDAAQAMMDQLAGRRGTICFCSIAALPCSTSFPKRICERMT